MLSSDNHPKLGSASVSRCLSKASTAISASETSEPLPLVHVFRGVRKARSARAPASRTAVSSWQKSAWVSSDAGNDETFDANGWRIHAVAEDEIVGRRQRSKYLEQLTGDRD